MNEQLALGYIACRMKDLGFENHYSLRFKHIRLQPVETLELKGSPQQLYLLVEPAEEIRIESHKGIFDLSDDKINELQYEHSGRLIIINQSLLINDVKMIEAIPIIK